MAIDFPNSPTNGQSYTSNGRTWQYDGTAWTLVVSAFTAPTTTTTITANTATTVDTFSTSTYRAAEVMLQVTQGSKYSTLKGIVLHDGTTASLVQYGLIEVGSPVIPLTVEADIDSSTVRIRVTITDAATTNATVRVVKSLIVV